MNEDSLLTFPCDIPVKVVGRNTDTLRDTVLAIVRAHCEGVDDLDVSERHSRQGSYLSLTVTVHAETRAQVDAVYRDLTASNEILIAL